MSLRLLRLMVLATVLLLGADAHAMYTGKQTNSAAEREITGLIVKFKSDVVLDLRQNSDGIVMSGQSDLDVLNQRYRIRKQAPLLRTGAVRTPDNPLRNVHLLGAAHVSDVESMAREYGKLDIVEYACPDYPLELYDVPNDPLYPHQWALNNTGQEYYAVLRREGDYNDTLILEAGTPDADIDGEEVFINPPDQTSTVVVAIVDTGIDWDHPDLAPVVWHNSGEIPDNGLDDDHNGYVDDVVGWDFTGWDESNWGNPFDKGEDNDPTDVHGHGTHCAGIVAAIINNGVGVSGVVPLARIMGLKTDPSAFSMSEAAMGIVYAADNGADVISMSWGTFYQLPTVEEALAYARSRGLVLVASNGNDGMERVNYPTGYDQTISVGATTSLDQVTSFSTFGINISVCAPGQSILSLRADETDMYARQYEPNVHIIDDYYYLASGTSMSGPYVAAEAAYLRSVSPGLKPEIVQGIIESTADDVIDPYGLGENFVGWDKYSGHGRINLNAALSAVPRARAVITEPFDFDIVSGDITVVGTADGDDFTGYILDYSTSENPSDWVDILNSSTPVTDGPLGTLNASGLDGLVTIRLRVGDLCESTVRVFVAGDDIAHITSPAESDTVRGWVSVTGTALCTDLTISILSYGVGSSPTEWVPIDTITAQTYETVLAQWTTLELPDGPYTLRLEVFSSTGLAASHTVAIDLKAPFGSPDGWSVDVNESLNRTPNLADLENDGVQEILIGTASTIKAFRPDGTLRTDITFPAGNFTYVPIAVGHLDSDDIDDFVAVSNTGTMYAILSASEPLQFTVTAPREPTRVLFDYGEPAVFLKDSDGDGIEEIHYCAGSSGAGAYQMFDVNDQHPCELVVSSTDERCLPADLDGDGYDEVYCVGDGYISQYDYCDGLIRNEELRINGVAVNAALAVLSAVDIDDDSNEELILFASAYTHPALPEQEFLLYAYDEDLALKEGWPHNTRLGAYFLPSAPVFGDLDGDGILEYAASLDNGVFARRLDGTPFLDNGSGSGLLAVTEEPASINNVLITDVDGDNQPDLVCYIVQGLLDFYELERIEAFDRWGNVIEGFPLLVSTIGDGPGHTPVIGDLDGDGNVDLLASSTIGTLNFRNFSQAEHHPDLDFCSSWRYNKQRNLSAAYRLDLEPILVCGDVDGDGAVTPADFKFLVEYLHKDGPAPDPMEIADVNGDGIVSQLDCMYLIDYLRKDGPAPICPDL